MAGVIIDSDLVNGRVVIHWEDDRYEHHTNLLLWVGAEIQLHAHSYAHDTDYGPGVYRFSDGEREEILTGPGRLHVPKGRSHAFRMVELVDGPGKLDCVSLLGVSQA